MKKLILGLTIFLLFTTILANTASAKKSVVHFDAIYTTDAYRSTTPKTIFGWDETPWLYLRLPETSFNFTRAWWESPTGDRYLTGSIGYDQDIWLTLGNHWYEVRELGDWDITARFIQKELCSRPICGRGSTSFTVTPEPISSILFIVGSATLAIRRYLTKKLKTKK